ncbi:MAG: phosphoribosylglycinamide formyltransferase [Bacteroidetes bacterium]|nr:phosphoribosylglycinamide formyltransferase [Bacteroidota bacterium]
MSGRKIHIAIFASGTGSNAARLIQHFRNHSSVNISLIVCNNPSAKVLDIAASNHIESLLIEKERFFKGDGYGEIFKERKIEWIVMAGFLWKVPVTLINAYPDRIVNIHPALLPKYGGKGMYGKYVHESVIAAKEKTSGITIHLVDEIYDHGRIIFQKECIVETTDTPETLAKKIQELEHEYYGKIVEEIVSRPSFLVFRKTNNE